MQYGDPWNFRILKDVLSRIILKINCLCRYIIIQTVFLFYMVHYDSNCPIFTVMKQIKKGWCHRMEYTWCSLQNGTKAAGEALFRPPQQNSHNTIHFCYHYQNIAHHFHIRSTSSKPLKVRLVYSSVSEISPRVNPAKHHINPTLRADIPRVIFISTHSGISFVSPCNLFHVDYVYEHP